MVRDKRTMAVSSKLAIVTESHSYRVWLLTKELKSSKIAKLVNLRTRRPCFSFTLERLPNESSFRRRVQICDFGAISQDKQKDETMQRSNMEEDNEQLVRLL